MRRMWVLVGLFGLLTAASAPAWAAEHQDAGGSPEATVDDPALDPAPEAAETEPLPPPVSIRRRRPGVEPLPPLDPLPLPRIVPLYERVPIPDRWRIVENLGVNERLYNPYDQNTLKGDRPVRWIGPDWFVNTLIISDTLLEARRLPTPVGVALPSTRNSLGAFGRGEQFAVVENLITQFSLIKGNTTFKPQDYEFRITPAFNFNYNKVRERGLLHANPEDGTTRYDDHIGIQEMFVDKHLHNINDRYDFFSIRAGIQPFNADFRGFLFLDQPFGIRFFGNYWNNRLQYNLAWFRRLDKNINSGLNRVFQLRSDEVFVANLFRQDWPVLGFTTQATALWNKNREGDRDPIFDTNGFLQRPAPIGTGRAHNYDVAYLGLNGDGHYHRLNLTYSFYWALGKDRRNPVANDRSLDINAQFFAAEPSIDFDWLRAKAFFLWASGDHNPFDGKATGFSAIFPNPNFAGADSSFFQRQAIPFIGGGGVQLVGRNSLLPDLRSSKEKGQSNFVNPGLFLFGIGADFDILPELRIITNVSSLFFENTSSLRVARVQGDIDNHIGEDISVGIIYRPLFINNILFRLSGAMLIPGTGMKDLFDDRDEDVPFYSIGANFTLVY